MSVPSIFRNVKGARVLVYMRINIIVGLGDAVIVGVEGVKDETSSHHCAVCDNLSGRKSLQCTVSGF
jgi:hypothetical protein